MVSPLDRLTGSTPRGAEAAGGAATALPEPATGRLPEATAPSTPLGVLPSEISPAEELESCSPADVSIDQQAFGGSESVNRKIESSVSLDGLRPGRHSAPQSVFDRTGQPASAECDPRKLASSALTARLRQTSSTCSKAKHSNTEGSSRIGLWLAQWLPRARGGVTLRRTG